MKARPQSERNRIYRMQKRLFDVVFSSLSLIVLSPILLIVAIGIKLSGPGPIFSRHRLIGLNGKEFALLKFRTMTIDATEQSTGPAFTIENDPRITAFGRLLRRTYLDELPALLSVLRADMSYVGPRPAVPLEVRHYSEGQRLRLSLKPGITGYWQTFGRERGITDLDREIEMDIEYLKKQSLSLDLKIIGKTLAMSLRSGGAY